MSSLKNSVYFLVLLVGTTTSAQKLQRQHSIFCILLKILCEMKKAQKCIKVSELFSFKPCLEFSKFLFFKHKKNTSKLFTFKNTKMSRKYLTQLSLSLH